MAVGGFSERLAFILEMDPSNAVAGMRRVGDAAERELGKTDDRLTKLGGSMQRFGAGAVAFTGVAAAALGGLASAYEEAEAESRKLDQAMSTNSSFAAEGRDSFDELAASLQDLTGVDGDAVTGMLGFLGTLGRTADEAQRAAPLIVDLAKRYGLELEPAARLVNNALEGNGARLERLIGPIGDAEGALGALQRTVGGFAEREAQTFSGQLEILKQNLGDVAEGIGGGVVSAVNDLIGPVKALADRFTELDPATQNMVGKLAAFGTVGAGLIGTVSFIGGSVLKLRDNFKSMSDAAGLSTTAVGNLKTGLAVAGIAAAGLATAIALVQRASDQADELAGGLSETVEASIRGASTFGEFQTRMEGLTGAISDLDSEMDGLAAPWDLDYVYQIEQGRDALLELQQRYAGVDETVRYLVNTTGMSTEAAYQQAIGARDDAAAHEELVAVVGEAAAAQIEEEQALADVNAQLEANRQRNQEAADAQRALVDAVLASFNANLALKDAVGATTTAIETATATTDDATTAIDETAAAWDNAEGAAYRQVAAAMAAAEQNKGAALTAQESAFIQLIEIQKVVDALAPGSPLRSRLQAYIDQLRQTTGTFIANLQTNYTGVHMQPGQRQSFADGGVIQGPAGAPVNVDAHAGEIVLNAAQQGNVAENLVGGGGAGAGKDTQPIQVIVKLDNRVIADALVAYNRVNGAVPIVVQAVA